MCLWIPLYETSLETTKSVISTFFEVFPNGILWCNNHEGSGYDAVLFGQIEPTVIDIDRVRERLECADHELVKKSLEDVGFGSSGREQPIGQTNRTWRSTCSPPTPGRRLHEGVDGGAPS